MNGCSFATKLPLRSISAASALSRKYGCVDEGTQEIRTRAALGLPGRILPGTPGVHLHANDREGLEKLCGYGARSRRKVTLTMLAALAGALTFKIVSTR